MEETLIYDVSLVNPTVPPRVTHGGWLLIREGRIAETGHGKPPETLKDRCKRLVDGHGGILLPGLVNAHTHAAMSLIKGFADDLPLMRWLEEKVFPAERLLMNPQAVYWGTLLSCWEMMTCGITTFADGYFHEGEAAEAARRSGLRAVMSQGIVDLPTPDCPDPGSSLDRARSFVQKGPWDSRVRPALFCHAPYTCSRETYIKAKEICNENHVHLFTHAAETKWEVKEIERRYGRSPIRYLSHLDILDEGTALVHCVWMDEEEIGIAASSGTSCIICTESNMKLGSGIAPLPQMLSSGVNVGLGTDGPASNNDLDLFGEMDLTSKIHKVHENDPRILDAATVLHLATHGGAKALGIKDLGLLEPGYLADLILIGVRRPSLSPMYNPVSHLVYAVRGGDVQMVWVEGRLIVQDGRPLTIDTEEIKARVQEITGRLSELT